MSKKTMILLSTALTVAVVAGFGLSEFLRSKKNDPVVARVNYDPIYQSELEKQLSIISPNQKITLENLPPEALNNIINDIAKQKLLLKAALDSNIDDKQDVKDAIKQAKETLIKTMFLQELTGNIVSEEELQTRYESLKANIQGKDEYHIRHILLPTKEDAEQVKRALKAATFEALASRYSRDQGTAVKGGDLGYVIPGQLDSTFEEAAFSLRKGQVSNPVQTQFGWHIIKLEDKREAKVMPYEQAKIAITQKLKEQKIRDFIDGQFKDAKVEVLLELKEKSAKENNG